MSNFETRLFINNEVGETLHARYPFCLSTKHPFLQYVDAKSSDRLTVYNPNEDTLISDKIHAAGEQDVDAAVDAAQRPTKANGAAWTPRSVQSACSSSPT